MFSLEKRVLMQHRFLSIFSFCLLSCLSLFAQSERVIYDGASASCWDTQLPRDMVSVDFDYEELRYDAEAKAIIDEVTARTRKILTENWAGLTQLAEQLIEKEIIMSDDIEKLFGPKAGKHGEERLRKEEPSNQVEDE